MDDSYIMGSQGLLKKWTCFKSTHVFCFIDFNNDSFCKSFFDNVQFTATLDLKWNNQDLFEMQSCNFSLRGFPEI